MQYYKEEGEKIVCELCTHYCTLSEEQVGMCGVEKNSHGVLENLSFGRPSAVNVDPIEKKPLYHFLPTSKSFSIGTVGCNYRCSFCQNWQISQNDTIPTSHYLSPKQAVEEALKSGCQSIAYTYNEPTVFYPYAKAIGLIAHEKGLKNVFITNGNMSKEVVQDMPSWVDAVNIDFKSNDAKYYKKELKGDLEQIKANIVALKKAKVWVEITTLLIPGLNDSNHEIEAMAKFIKKEVGKNTPWHLSGFHPDYQMTDRPATPLYTLERAKQIGCQKGLRFIYLGNTNERNTTYCKECGEILILRQGYSVLQYSIVDGACPNCNAKAKGRFS